MLLQFLDGCRKDFLLKRASLPTLPKPVIGLDEAIANVKVKIVDNHMLAVVGMGGIGKTTLVKKLYHQIHADFKRSSFLENVKENDIVEVKKKIIMDLCDSKLEDPTTYLRCVEECWIEMKVLVVIDDVKETQIIELLGEDIDGIKRSENGSRLIMTRRNWKDFQNVILKDGKFEMDGLNEQQAMELFSWKAFRQPTPPHDFASITNEVVDACQGLPLSLEVTGSWLFTKQNPQEWKESLSLLKNAKPFGGDCIENDKLWGRLKISYIDLAYEEREMFLDIACFFSEYNSKFETGVTIQKALQIWKVPSRYSLTSSLQNLMDRSLVKVNDKGNLAMHDQLRDMGRRIVKEASNYKYREQSRIWDKEEAKQVLFNDTVTPNIQAIWCKSIESLPTTLGDLRHLTKLKLQGCENLKEFPQSIGNISSLSILDLSYCKSIESLPTTFVDLKHLTKLMFRGCENVGELLQSIRNISSLSILDLSYYNFIDIW
ncbi:unnamed protein product [Sphagnum jensenii]|uniref:NB-ARC domain-containing protein n=1 Tax=Sphagnum jensenii TaxID=128206 RepID=A0ABP1B537_9BRYO